MSGDSVDRLRRMLDSLAGLSVGDAFGQDFHGRSLHRQLRKIGPGPWKWSDDTEMALSICRMLSVTGRIEQDQLARAFLEECDPSRGYGPGLIFDYFPKLKNGAHWRDAAGGMFAGQGSCGNGAAMRVAPLGAFFADDFVELATQARLSAEVTHSHAEGIAGAIAVAVATGVATLGREAMVIAGPRQFLELILPHVPASEVRSQLELAHRELGPRAPTIKAASLLGNGSRVTAQDTVPFCLWMAGQHLEDYETALWETVSALGDMDTNCAIVGGIVAAAVGEKGIPEVWLQSREALPSVLRNPGQS